MVMSYNPQRDVARDLAAIRAPLLVLAGQRDESFFAERYEPTIAPHARATVTVLPGVTHRGLVVNGRAAEEIEAWLAKLP
jgi:pimeloyl-ACP methyl ester carboxylesterase